MPSRRAIQNSAIVAGAVVLLAVTAGCGEESAPPESAEAQSSVPAPDAASQESAAAAPITLEVTADKTHAVQPGDDLHLEVNVTGFVLDGTKIGAEAELGAGHYHVYLGDPGEKPLLVSADSSAVVNVPVETNDGTHSLRIQLRNHDHSPLDPPTEAVVRLIIYRL